MFRTKTIWPASNAKAPVLGALLAILVASGLTLGATPARASLVKGCLDSTPGRVFTIQFYSNPPGGDEGKKFIGQREVTTARTAWPPSRSSPPEGWPWGRR